MNAMPVSLFPVLGTVYRVYILTNSWVHDRSAVAKSAKNDLVTSVLSIPGVSLLFSLQKYCTAFSPTLNPLAMLNLSLGY